MLLLDYSYNTVAFFKNTGLHTNDPSNHELDQSKFLVKKDEFYTPLLLEEFLAHDRDGKYRSYINLKLNAFLNKHVNLNRLGYNKIVT